MKQDPVDREDVLDVFSNNNSPFEGLQTKSLQNAYFNQNFNFVEYKEIHLGNKLIKKKNGLKQYLVEKEETFVYIPLIKSLEQLLSNKRIRSLILRPPYQTKTGLFYDICDGTVYKNDLYFQQNPCALMLILYHDEVEVCNPLGSKSTKHKLDMYYYTIANLSPKFRSKHCSVRLLAILNSKLVKKYGIHSIMNPIIKDLLKLYDGVTVKYEEETFRIKGKVVLCAGDTLGQHLWGGFKEGILN